MKNIFRGIALVSAVALATVGMAVPASADISPTAGDPETLTAAPLTTFQTNGTVWAMEIVNGVVYVGGNFTAVRPSGSAPGTNEVARKRLAAFDAKTGALLPWAPSATAVPFTAVAGTTPDKNCTITGTTVECSTVWSIKATPDKSKLIIGGDFQAIDGKPRAGIAAFSPTTGALDITFKPGVVGRVYSVAIANNTVYVGGNVTKAAGVARGGLAAFSLPSGALLPWAPTAAKGATATGSNGVRAIVATDDGSRVIIGGGFNSINATSIHGLAAVDGTLGESAPWASKVIPNITALTSLLLKDGVVYTTGDAAGSTAEGIIAFDSMTGNQLWYDSCRGASHSVMVVRGVVYSGSHAHDCGAAVDGWPEQYQGYSTADRHRYKLRAEIPFGGNNAKILQWFPDTNDGNGPRAMATDGDNLWIGGEFTIVDNKAQQGLTRFTFLDQGGVSRKPYTPEKPVVYSTVPGEVDINWKTTQDPDNRDLEYWVIRDHKTTAPIAKIKSSDKPWLQSWLSYTDTAVDPGSSHTYDIRAVDPMGTQSIRSTAVTLTVATDATTLSSIPKQEGAIAHYTFDSMSGSSYLDSVSGRTASKGFGVTSVPGTGVAGDGVALSGFGGGAVIDSLRSYAERQLSFEMTFKTSTTKGGMLASQGDSASTTGTSSNDRGTLYMSNDGRLNFGMKPDGNRTNPWQDPFSSSRVVSTTAAFNDDIWHHVAVTFAPGSGMRIYVDGYLQAEDPLGVWSRSLNAYWRIGGDRVSGWANAPTSSWFAGSVDEAAWYGYPLTSGQVARHSAAFLGQ